VTHRAWRSVNHDRGGDRRLLRRVAERAVVDEVEERVDAIGMALAHELGDFAVARGTSLTPSSRRKVSSSASAGARMRAPARAANLDGQAADAARGTHHEQHVALGEIERARWRSHERERRQAILYDARGSGWTGPLSGWGRKFGRAWRSSGDRCESLR
jgi:hypothetical protein